MSTGQLPRLAVLASGRGTNLSAMIESQRHGTLGAEIVLVVSDVEDAPALDKARAAGIPALFIDPDSQRRGRIGPRFTQALLAEFHERQVDLVALAGFMRIVGPEIVNAFRWRMLNIHPSLLPAFPGLAAVEQALAYGVKYTGCTVHFVDEGMDTGPIVLQEAVPVMDDDDVESLTRRIQEAEHRIYPRAVSLLAAGRLRVEGRRVSIIPTGEESDRP